MKTIWAVLIGSGMGFQPMISTAATLGQDAQATLTITQPNYRLDIIKKGFRYSFTRPDGSVILPPHASSGLVFSGGAVAETVLQKDGTLEVTNDQGVKAKVEIEAAEHHLRFSVTPASGVRVVMRTGGATSPAYGLADHAAFARTTTDVSGYSDDKFHAQTQPGHKRMISNFVIFPRQGIALVNMEKGPKLVRVTAEETAQGSQEAKQMPAMYYFIGSPEQIYAAFQKARNREGFPVYKPKYEFFGVGWEAFGALGWKTNEGTVTENVEKYLSLGYPLKWMVVGSGFWPNADSNMCATTSFGLWDKVRYPDPKRFVSHFKSKGLKFFLGLRISFIKDGPYSAEGVAKGYFLKEAGEAKAHKIAFPKLPAYLLDASNPEAVKWYVGLCQKWMDVGVDGFKEDLFGYGVAKMREGNIDAVNKALMDKGVFIMGRNNYLGSACDTHRIEDFNFDQNQDRGPINCLAFSYSGLPYAYPDILGGTFGEGRKMPPLNSERMQKYMMRVAQFDSVCPSMAVGMGPWNFDSAEVEKVMLGAAQLHDKLLPYIYSAALDAYETGFPWTMAPLPLVFPDDPKVYDRENTTVRGYQWMFGPSLLACPLYGNDYDTATTRDIYLPAGKWMDYDTGKVYQGPTLLKDFALPAGKTPLFVGGKGVVVESGLKAVVYPVATGTYRFTDRDGARTTITTATGWDNVTVTDTTANQPVKFDREPKTGAIRFPVTPGHNYEIK
jgi:alpha-glucosidase (family GH31 glycosyl hydrolase)